MMTEQLSNTQTLVERDALHPTQPTTDEIIIRGEDAYPTRTEGIVTSMEVSPESIEDKGFKAATDELDGWLLFKVKKELVDQVFKNGTEHSAVNIESVASVIKLEVAAEKEKHFQDAQLLENSTIPKATQRTEPNFMTNHPYNYWQKDVDNLWSRVEVHMQMVSYIDAFEQTGEDWLYDLSESYIKRARTTARDEAITILLEQKEALEAHQKIDSARISELEDSIELLTIERTDAKIQIEDRDLQLHEYEMIDHLTENAKQLAA